MQKHLSLLADVRGCMTRFDPLTPQIVAAQSEDGLTYEELQTVLAECGMDIRKVVFDGTRSFQNAFYADFEQGHYCWIPFCRANLKDIVSTMDQNFRSPGFGQARRNHEWETFYMMEVPLPMQIWDFERRYQMIEPEKVFSVWSSIHTHLDYANGMWKPEVLEYVFAMRRRPSFRSRMSMARSPFTAVWVRDPSLQKQLFPGRRTRYVPCGLRTAAHVVPDWFPQR